MSANTNADVAAMVDTLNEIGRAIRCGNVVTVRALVNDWNFDPTEAAALLQSQEEKITRLSALLEERTAVLATIANHRGRRMVPPTRGGRLVDVTHRDLSEIARQALTTEQG